MHNAVRSNRVPTSGTAAKCVAVFSVQGSQARSQQVAGVRANKASEALKLVAVTATLASLALSASASDAVEPVYFGNGCYWGRQYDFVKTEQTKLGRTEKDISAVVGYAGGRKASPSGKVCYYYTNELDTIYEKLGHAEVVQVELRDDDSQMSKEDQFRMYAKTYFSEFNKLRSGKMQRQDPQDMGAGYRNTIGIPGGVKSDLFKILQEENVNSMDLREGAGNENQGPLGAPTEGDELNTVWVVDSTKLPFFRAEVYHQFHNGLGKKFPTNYTKDLKEQALKNKLIGTTGCPEIPFF